MNFNGVKKYANDMQNRAQMKESKCSKDILKCANEKCRTNVTYKSWQNLTIFMLNTDFKVWSYDK